MRGLGSARVVVVGLDHAVTAVYCTVVHVLDGSYPIVCSLARLQYSLQHHRHLAYSHFLKPQLKWPKYCGS